MRIAIFSDNFYPELSGITDSLVLLGHNMASLGHEILFVVPYYAKKDYGGRTHFTTSIKNTANINVLRLPSIRYPYSPTRQSRITLPSGRSLRHLKRFKVDVIHTNSPFGTGLEALLAARILKVPLVGTNHTIIGEFVSHDFLKKAFNHFFSWYYNKCIIVTAPSNSLLQDMKAHGFKKPALVISNPVDLHTFFYEPDHKQHIKYKRAFGLSDFTILYTGRLAAEKRIDVIIKAFAQLKSKLPDATLAIAGHGNAASKLKALVKKLNLSAQVKFLGMLTGEDFIHIHQASDAFVTMSTSESQCLSLMHAMSCGLPVIGARARALPEYINSQNGLLVEPGDVNDLADKIFYIFKHRNKAHVWGQNGMHFVQQYQPSLIAKKWEKVYIKAINAYAK